MSFLSALIHAEDPTVDSIVVGGLTLIGALCVFTGWDVLVKGHEFSAWGFSSSGAALLAAIGGGKWARDGRS